MVGSSGCFSKSDNFKIRAVECAPEDENCSDLGEINGIKWYDLDTDGVKDATEVVIVGWRVDSSAPSTAYTDVNGVYHLLGVANTQYTITEVFPNVTWLPTTPTSGIVTTDNTGTAAGPDFGNVCLGAGGGMTLGFWSNKNGQKLFEADDLALMVSLNLRNGAGADFNPASYAQFRNWLLSPNATSMAYMLSAQLAAMELNVLNGKVNGSALIYAPGTTSANGAGFATVNAIMAEANTSLGTYGFTPAGHAERAHQEALKNALDNANNNKNFVQAGPEACPFVTPY